MGVEMTQNLKSIRVRYCEFYSPAVHIDIYHVFLNFAFAISNIYTSWKGFQVFGVLLFIGVKAGIEGLSLPAVDFRFINSKEKSRSAYQN